MNFKKGSVLVVVMAVAGIIALGAGLAIRSFLGKPAEEVPLSRDSSQNKGGFNLTSTKLATIPRDLFKLVSQKNGGSSGCFGSFCWPFHATFDPNGQSVIYTFYGAGKLHLFQGDTVLGIYDIPEETSYDEDDWFSAPAFVSISPDGKHVAYLVSQPREISGADNTELKREQEACEKEKKSVFIQRDSDVAELPSGNDEDLVEAFSVHCEKAKTLVKNQSKPQWLVALDGKEGRTYDAVENIIFSEDGQHIAYVAKEKRENDSEDMRSFIVLDGVEGESYNEISLYQFLPGTSELVYTGWNERFVNGVGTVSEEVLVAGKRRSEMFGHIEPHISKDGKVIAFRGDKKEVPDKHDDSCGTTFTVWGWGEEPVIFPGNCGGIGIMTEDGSAITYTLREGREWKSFIRRRDSSVIPVNSEFVTFSPDGKHYALERQTRDKKFKSYMVVDGKDGKQYDFIYDRIYFSPDGSKVAYVAVNGDAVVSEDRFVVVNEEKQSQHFSEVSSLRFSPDSKRLAYVAGDKPLPTSKPKAGSELEELPDPDFENEDTPLQSYPRFIVVDGKPGKSYPYPLGNPIFSPDSRHIVYRVNNENAHQSFLVIDGKEGIAYDKILTNIKFSPDSSKVVYGVRKGNELWWIADDVPR